MILQLDRIPLHSDNAFGNKAVQLGNLKRLGFNVPDGFAISNDVFPLTDSTKSQVLQCFHALRKPVVVRSSAAGEDSPRHSFAGVFRSFLNVSGEGALFASIAACRMASDSREARSYMDRIGVAEARMAVIVQEMVAAEWSGIMFTVDPIHGRYVLIEGARGAAEKIASGRTQPSSFLIGRERLDIFEARNLHCLEEQDVIAVATIGCTVERVVGCAQDIEFAVTRHKIYLVQTRPISGREPSLGGPHRSL